MADIKQEVTDRIIERLENVGEFEMPFPTFGARNFKSGHVYKGINQILIGLSGYTSPYWGTPKQWMKAGANIKGAKTTRIVFWNKKVYEDEKTGEEKFYMYPIWHFILNSEQVTGWEAPAKEALGDAEAIEKADSFFKNVSVETFYASGRACYSPSDDKIQMPPMGDFKATKTSSATETFYSTLAHENVHATMHKKRCDRNMDCYASEELVAEIGAAILCSKLEISNQVRDDHIAYIKSWLKKLKNDKQFIFTASSKAQEAVEWMEKQQKDVLSKAA